MNTELIEIWSGYVSTHLAPAILNDDRSVITTAEASALDEFEAALIAEYSQITWEQTETPPELHKCVVLDTVTECYFYRIHAPHFRILSVDAWRDSDGWTYNNWWTVGHAPLSVTTWSNRRILKFMRDNYYLSDGSKGKIHVAGWRETQYNIEIQERSNYRPLYAIEIGSY